MKAKFTRVGKRSLSVILTLMMIVSTMLVGMVTTNAATVNFWRVCGSFNGWDNSKDKLNNGDSIEIDLNDYFFLKTSLNPTFGDDRSASIGVS